VFHFFFEKVFKIVKRSLIGMDEKENAVGNSSGKMIFSQDF
jgi:hypothetical protein